MKMINRIKLISVVVLLLISSCSRGQVESSSYEFMLNRLLVRNVPEISVDSLEGKLQSFTILDSREPEEYKVSHIKNAIHVGYDHFDINAVPDKDQPIVVYCSVGYRSEKITQKLLDNGYSKVYNLFGGIFEWVNQEKPVYKNNKKTQKIHAYSKLWGIWLNKGEKVYSDK